MKKRDWFEDVARFMFCFGERPPKVPTLPSMKVRRLRTRLMVEEARELREAFAEKDLAKIADALADHIYIQIGTAIACGIDLRPVFEEVHAANMRKGGGKMRADGKILKPKDWRGPDIEAALRRGKLGALLAKLAHTAPPWAYPAILPPRRGRPPKGRSGK